MADCAFANGAVAIAVIIAITEGVPVLDMTKVYPFVRERGARLIGPNCPGLITPGRSKVGIIPGRICTPGNIGVEQFAAEATARLLHIPLNVGLLASALYRAVAIVTIFALGPVFSALLAREKNKSV